MSQQNPRSRKNEVTFTLPATPIYQFLNDLTLKKSSQIPIGNSAIHVPLNANRLLRSLQVLSDVEFYPKK